MCKIIKQFSIVGSFFFYLFVVTSLPSPPPLHTEFNKLSFDGWANKPLLLSSSYYTGQRLHFVGTAPVGITTNCSHSYCWCCCCCCCCYRFVFVVVVVVAVAVVAARIAVVCCVVLFAFSKLQMDMLGVGWPNPSMYWWRLIANWRLPLLLLLLFLAVVGVLAKGCFCCSKVHWCYHYCYCCC